MQVNVFYSNIFGYMEFVTKITGDDELNLMDLTKNTTIAFQVVTEI